MRSKATFGIAVILLVVSGCSSGPVSGEPTSQSTFSPPASPTPSNATAVLNPLRVEKIQSDMCTGLTSGQLTPYVGAIRKQDPDKDSTGAPLCAWLPNNNSMADVTLYADSKDDNVTDLYQARAGDAFFEKVPLVAGYPAVRRSGLSEGPKRGDCMTIVAVSDRSTISVLATATGDDFQYYTAMCTVTDKLAEAAIANLKARG